jgi:shikimate kinase
MTIERIWLTGFMATGKSRVVRPLAAALDWTPIDLDKVIEDEAHESIAHIFKEGGEGAFRALEAQAVENASRVQHAVVATGGGSVLSETNRAAMRRDGFIVCLDARPETIRARIQDSGARVSDRPLLGEGNTMARIEQLKSERDPLYRDADIIIDTDDLTPDEVTHRIILAFRERTTPATSAT